MPQNPSRDSLRGLAGVAFLAALAGFGCDDTTDRVHPSYDRCAGDEPCGLATLCQRAGLTTTDAGASFCSAECSFSRECPGVSARCVAVATDGGLRGQCYRACESNLDCRDGMLCHAVRIDGSRVGVCVPDTGLRRCRTALDCAPFDDLCDLTDGGVSPFDAAVSGVCRMALPASP